MTRQQAIVRDGPFAPGQLALPFYTKAQRALATALEDWVRQEGEAVAAIVRRPVQSAARDLVKALAEGGWLRVATEGDMQSVCLCRQAFSWLADLCDYTFALQGLAAVPLKACGRQDLVTDLATGRAIGALALTEPDAGSDLAAVTTRADRVDDGYLLTGEKAWIGHAGVADLLVLLARTGGAGAFGLSLFAVSGRTPGLRQTQGPEMLASRALGQLSLDNAKVTQGALLGGEGQGFVHAVQTIESFRMSVGAAANGFARSALQSAVGHVVSRQVKDGLLAEKQLVQAALADMQVALNASELLVAQAAWEWDRKKPAAALRSGAAKLLASETAHRIVDQAVQLLGAKGLAANGPTEQLYRQVRSLRVYEGTSEIQRLTLGQAVATGQL